MDYTPSRCKRATRSWCYALCSSRRASHRRSNLRRLADKRACRLGFARLSAPDHCVSAEQEGTNLSSPRKQKRGLLHLGITQKERRFRQKDGFFAQILCFFHFKVEILRISSFFMLFLYRRFLARRIFIRLSLLNRRFQL